MPDNARDETQTRVSVGIGAAHDEIEKEGRSRYLYPNSRWGTVNNRFSMFLTDTNIIKSSFLKIFK